MCLKFRGRSKMVNGDALGLGTCPGPGLEEHELQSKVSRDGEERFEEDSAPFRHWNVAVASADIEARSTELVCP